MTLHGYHKWERTHDGWAGHFKPAGDAMILPVVLGLVQAAPALIELFDDGDDTLVGKVADVAATVAKSVTGETAPADALQALQSDPHLMLEYQKQTSMRAISLYREETKRLQAVNETIRSEATSSDAYVRRMRPTMGYALILSWTMVMSAIVYVVVTDPAAASAVIVAVADLSVMWSVALSVLGLYVYKRSEDKRPTAKTGLSVLARLFGGRAGD